jgi:hypothetical protein
MLKEARDKHNAHYYTRFSPEKILKEIRRHELQPDQELLTYLVNKQLLTKQTSKKYLN